MLQDVEASRRDMKNEAHNITLKYEQIEAELRDKVAECKELQDQLVKQDSKCESLRQELHQVRNRLSQTETAHDSLKRECKTYTDHFNDLERKLKNEQQQNGQLKSEIERIDFIREEKEAEINLLQRDVVKLKAQLHDKDKEIGHLKAVSEYTENVKAEAEQRAFTTEIDLNARINALTDERDSLSQQVADSQKVIQELRNLADNLKIEIAKLSEDLKKKQNMYIAANVELKR